MVGATLFNLKFFNLKKISVVPHDDNSPLNSIYSLQKLILSTLSCFSVCKFVFPVKVKLFPMNPSVARNTNIFMSARRC